LATTAQGSSIPLRGRARTRRYVSDLAAKSFEPFAAEVAYINVNERLVRRLVRRLAGKTIIDLLDVAAGTGLNTSILCDKAHDAGAKLHSTLLDLDMPALQQARVDVNADRADFIYASADHLPLNQSYDAVIFANSIHLLSNESKEMALQECSRVLRPGGILAVNSTFYDGAYPEESKPFYSRWIRRAIVEINQRLPHRNKSGSAQAMEFLPAQSYVELIGNAGFRVVETRERRVHLSQAAVRAISSYKEFAKGALHASDEDADEASRALQATVQQTFHDLKMKYLPRTWLEIVAVKA
jgi:ubiquinone/menaquinone biosynthesis C-methylase UbiE